VTEAGVEVERTGETVRITISGEIDLANVADLETQVLGAISNQLTHVVVDLGKVSYIDSAGLRVLFVLGSRLTTLQIGFRLLVPLHSAVRKVVDLSGLGVLASIEPPA
jgi:anti-anti-sigma factor